METSVFLKTMNNQTQRSPSRVLAVLILWAALPTVPAHGQTQESSGPDHFAVPLSDPSRPARVEASLVNGGITVKGYDGKEVVVEARARNRESARSNSNMKRIIVSSTGLSVDSSLKLSAVNDGNIVVTGVDGELEVNDVNGAVTLTNVSGSAVAHALNGRLLATFTRVNQQPMAFSSLNGEIDVTFPADLKANLTLKSDRGEIFTDFDVQMQAAPVQQIVEDG